MYFIIFLLPLSTDNVGLRPKCLFSQIQTKIHRYQQTEHCKTLVHGSLPMMASAFRREPIISHLNDGTPQNERVRAMDTMQDPANQSPGKIRSERGERPKIVGKKLSTLSVRDSDMDFNELTPDLKDTTSGQSSTSRFGMTNETAQNDNALKLRDNNSLDTQNPEVRPRSRMCCGGHPSKGDDAKTFQNIYPHSVEPSADDCNELSTTRSSPGDLADSSTAPKGNFQPNHQSQGLFNLLLQDTTEDELVLEGDLAAERGISLFHFG